MELTREALLGLDDTTVKEVTINGVKGWDKVFIRDMRGEDRLILEALDKPTEFTAHMWVALLSMCDAKGNRLFTKDDYDSFSKKNLNAIIQIAQAAYELSALSVQAQEAIEKN